MLIATQRGILFGLSGESDSPGTQHVEAILKDSFKQERTQHIVQKAIR